jgi:hypothetical protein
MTYAKPEVVRLANAVTAIQKVDKLPEGYSDSFPPNPILHPSTMNAYQADE